MSVAKWPFSQFHVIVVVKLSTWPLGKIYVGNTCPIATDGDDGDDDGDLYIMVKCVCVCHEKVTNYGKTIF